jgi:hypothetical protein
MESNLSWSPWLKRHVLAQTQVTEEDEAARARGETAGHGAKLKNWGVFFFILFFVSFSAVVSWLFCLSRTVIPWRVQWDKLAPSQLSRKQKGGSKLPTAKRAFWSSRAWERRKEGAMIGALVRGIEQGTVRDRNWVRRDGRGREEQGEQQMGWEEGKDPLDST